MNLNRCPICKGTGRFECYHDGSTPVHPWDKNSGAYGTMPCRNCKGTGEITVPKIALIGCGRWGKNIARVLYELGALGGIVEPRPLRQSIPVAHHQMTGQDFLAAHSHGYDAVAIATPSEDHYELASMALHRDLHTFVEKPMCMDGDEAIRLYMASVIRARTLMVGHIMHYHRGFQDFRSALQKDPSPLLSIDAIRVKEQEPHYSESALWRLAPHDISMILSFIHESPQRVHPHLSHNLSEVRLEWPLRSLTAEVRVGHGYSLNGRTFTAKTENETYEFKDFVPAEDPEPLKEEMSHFISCIETHRTPITDGAEGMRVVRLLDWISKGR